MGLNTTLINECTQTCDKIFQNFPDKIQQVISGTQNILNDTYMSTLLGNNMSNQDNTSWINQNNDTQPDTDAPEEAVSGSVSGTKLLVGTVAILLVAFAMGYHYYSNYGKSNTASALTNTNKPNKGGTSSSTTYVPVHLRQNNAGIL